MEANDEIQEAVSTDWTRQFIYIVMSIMPELTERERTSGTTHGINGCTTKTPLGFALEMPEGIHAFILARSSMGTVKSLINGKKKGKNGELEGVILGAWPQIKAFIDQNNQ